MSKGLVFLIRRLRSGPSESGRGFKMAVIKLRCSRTLRTSLVFQKEDEKSGEEEERRVLQN